MILIPSLEILAGNLVRLNGGTDEEPIVLSEDPLRTARELRQTGAMFFHVVDLDAVLGETDNNEVLAEFSENMIPYQVRGGIQTPERADEILQLGADCAVLGALPFRDGAAAKALVDRFGMRVAATLDVKGGCVLDGGEGEDSTIDLGKAMKKLKKTGVQRVIYNSVECHGEDADLDLEELSRVVTDGAFQVYVRCTLHQPEEMAPLLKLQEEGLVGVILNHALASDSAQFSELLPTA